MYIKSIVVSGADVSNAFVNFEPGTNIVQGGSGTGKSYIVECIQFALGASSPPKKIKQAKGYTNLKVTFGLSGDQFFTVEREFIKNAKVWLVDEEGVRHTLTAKHDAKNSNTLSGYFLRKLGLDGKLLLTGTKSLNSASFSLREFEKLFVVDESRIVAQSSPVGRGQDKDKSKEKSILQLLLTGRDDSAVKDIKKEVGSKVVLKHRAEAVEDIINRFYNAEEAGHPGHENKLSYFYFEVQDRLAEAESDLQEALTGSEELFKKKEKGITSLNQLEAKLSENQVLSNRFSMLDKKYRSDSERLTAIAQTTALLGEADDALCPTCGNHFDATSCPSDINELQKGVAVELGRIQRNILDLSDVRNSLGITVEKMSGDIERTKAEVAAVEGQIASRLQTKIQHANDYRELLTAISHDQVAIDQRLSVKERLSQELAKLLILVAEDQPTYTVECFNDLLEALAAEVQAILQRWSFPECVPVTFDLTARDIVIGESDRKDFGKGHRAIAFSAFILGIMEMTRKAGRHPGFVVLDSPLTAYKEGDTTAVEDRDEVSRDLVYAFYRDIAESYPDTQIIILENKEPEDSIISLVKYEHFTRNREKGRYGFFPVTG
ncbi:chromosome segregation protein [compost metagenome]